MPTKRQRAKLVKTLSELRSSLEQTMRRLEDVEKEVEQDDENNRTPKKKTKKTDLSAGTFVYVPESPRGKFAAVIVERTGDEVTYCTLQRRVVLGEVTSVKWDPEPQTTDASTCEVIPPSKAIKVEHLHLLRADNEEAPTQTINDVAAAFKKVQRVGKAIASQYALHLDDDDDDAAPPEDARPTPPEEARPTSEVPKQLCPSRVVDAGPPTTVAAVDVGNGWWLKKDPRRWYYVHEATGITQWDAPTGITDQRPRIDNTPSNLGGVIQPFHMPPPHQGEFFFGQPPQPSHQPVLNFPQPYGFTASPPPPRFAAPSHQQYPMLQLQQHAGQ